MECLTGQTPFNYESSDLSELIDVTRRIDRGEVDFDPSSKRRDVSPGARDFVLSCLALDPKARLTAEGMLWHPWITELIVEASKKRRNEAALWRRRRLSSQDSGDYSSSVAAMTAASDVRVSMESDASGLDGLSCVERQLITNIRSNSIDAALLGSPPDDNDPSVFEQAREELMLGLGNRCSFVDSSLNCEPWLDHQHGSAPRLGVAPCNRGLLVAGGLPSTRYPRLDTLIIGPGGGSGDLTHDLELLEHLDQISEEEAARASSPAAALTSPPVPRRAGGAGGGGGDLQRAVSVVSVKVQEEERLGCSVAGIVRRFRRMLSWKKKKERIGK
jgi:hypothetical protein